MSEEFIEFETGHLLSKWGFQDGEQLVELLDQAGLNRWSADSDEWWMFTRLVLCEVVERFVCPQIENDIKPYRMQTTHNPMRVYEVDGCHMSDWPAPPTLRPATVQVATRQILQVARDLQNEEHDLTERSPQNKAVFLDQGWE